MVALSSSAMHNLVDTLKNTYPDISFKEGERFYWSPKNQTVSYKKSALHTERGTWSLLHELSHGLLDHINFVTDFELLCMERDAWELARQLGKDCGFIIKEDHIQDCLDSYRQWLYLRSTCPHCTSAGLQSKDGRYRCINCNNIWRVSKSRMCRSYRRKVHISNGI